MPRRRFRRGAPRVGRLRSGGRELRRPQEVDERVAAGLSARQRRPPVRPRPRESSPGRRRRSPTSTSPTIRPPTSPRRSPSWRDAGLAQDVEPERRLAAPSHARRARALGGRAAARRRQLAGDRLARGQSGGLSALRGRARRATGRRRRRPRRRSPAAGSISECGQASVDPLRALRRRAARARRRAATSRPPCSGRRGRSRSGPGTAARSALPVVDPVAVADLRVAVAVCGVGELERDERLAVERGSARRRGRAQLAARSAPISFGRKSSGAPTGSAR